MFNPNTPVAAPYAIYRSHLDPTNVPAAQALGYTGAGVKIGQVDTGAFSGNPVLTGKVAYNLDVVTPAASNTGAEDDTGHGTVGAEIMVGHRVGAFQGGIAPDATLYMAHAISASGHISTADALTGTQDLIDQGVHLINNSWNSIVPYDPATRKSFAATIGSDYDTWINQNNALIVFAAGNESNTQPGIYGAIPDADPDVLKGWLTVVATNGDKPTILASYSNQCGLAADWCLAAPGDVVVLDPEAQQGDATYGYQSWSGTSFSAPQVTAAAALTWQAFPWMTNDQVRQTILSTATDIGDPGVDAVYGHGLLNVGKAVGGPASFGWGTQTYAVTPGNYTFTNSITGSGGLIKEGAGTLTLTGFDLYQGGTQVLNGTLQVNNYVSSDVTVGPTGTIGGHGVLGGNLTNDGQVKLTGGNLTVKGNWNPSNSGVLTVQVGNQLIVNGAATLQGQLALSDVATGYTVTQSNAVVTAGTLTGQFDQVTANPSVFLGGSVTYTGQQALVTVQRQSATSVAGLTADAGLAQAASQLDTAFDAADDLAAAPPETLTGSQAQFLASAASIEHTATIGQAQATLDSVAGSGYGQLQGLLTQQQVWHDRAAQERMNTLSGTDEPGVWVSVTHVSGKSSPTGMAQARGQTDDVTVGLDGDVGETRVGGYLTSSQTNLTWNRQGGRAQGHLFGAGVYARQVWGTTYLQGQLAYGHGHLDSQRTVLLGTSNTDITARIPVTQESAHVEAGHAWTVGAASTLTPFVGLAWDRTQQSGFADRGGLGFGLNTSHAQSHQNSGQLGLRWATAWQNLWNTGTTVHLSVYGLHEQAWSRSQGGVAAAYQGAPDSPFVLSSPSWGRSANQAGISLLGQTGVHTTWFVRADRRVGRGDRSSSVTAGVKVAW